MVWIRPDWKQGSYIYMWGNILFGLSDETSVKYNCLSLKGGSQKVHMDFNWWFQKPIKCQASHQAGSIHHTESYTCNEVTHDPNQLHNTHRKPSVSTDMQCSSSCFPGFLYTPLIYKWNWLVNLTFSFLLACCLQSPPNGYLPSFRASQFYHFCQRPEPSLLAA